MATSTEKRTSPTASFLEYEHYKGGRYEYVCEAFLESDGTPLVVYRSVSTGAMYARPRSEFFEQVPVGDRLVPRFRQI